MRKLIFLAAAALAVTSLSGCEYQAPPVQTKDTQAQKAAAAANSIQFTENAEIENIKYRLELTSSPSKVGYIVLFNDAGQPILYTSVKGKVTSGSKRLTPPYELKRLDQPSDGQPLTYEVVDAPSDEGTYGSSNPYIYFRDMNGTYHQWSGDYLYSDQPIRLKVEPIAVTVATK